ncbi:quinol monooxygenase YgiN [Aeromicrobium panaciterrae]|uniref:Quinol monooxygenase YgiN n=1 Tax=Aeromicrobium panaciterrae TaxID=363861 RepID=A0ABU1UK43_9ACTN|nr:NIPSNAP family protein [Aeromicrobium panaciterrae]MDR7085546.1 quinol monooxygenase YgiN [Aeromicrobium panaciterrae]
MPHLSDRCCSVVELRQYTMVPGRRDELIEVFEREFVETQEAVGSHVVGIFTDLDDPDRFVWLRGFASNDERSTALRAFYTGPAWRAHGAQAAATMTDSDDVLLLQPGRGLPETSASEPSTYGVTVYALEPGTDDAAAVSAAPTDALAVFRTHPGPNGFPALPVREGEQVVVVLTAGDPSETPLPGATVLQQLRLAPTPRSALR